MARIDITYDFALPVDRVYAFLAEHENLGPLFGAKVRRVQDGTTGRNGTGSVRALQVGPLPWFEETVTHAVPDKVIDYEISKGSPLRGHTGRMEFVPVGTGSRLHYVIEFGAVLPLLDRVIAKGLERNLRSGLKTIDAKA
jgi:uncharacterized protein YndB with AHSA1/START domain